MRVCACWWCSTAPHPCYQPSTDTLHTAAPPAAVDTTRDADDRGSADRQTDTGPAGNTGGSLRAGRRLETYTRMNIFSTSYVLSCIQTDWETLLYFGHESTLTITSVKSICPQNSYSKTKKLHFSVIHNQSNFPSRKHLDSAVLCYAAPLVAVWPLASMLNQLDQIPIHLRHDFLPQMPVLWV